MLIEDPVPPKKSGPDIGQDLSKFSIGELKTLIELLKEEIARVEMAIAAKESTKNAAEAAFRR